MGRRLTCACLLLLLVGAAGWFSATTVSAQSKIVYVHAERIIPPNGPAVYDAYCASCHGPSGRGNGPAVPLLNHAVPNLTLVAVRDGTFDRIHVMSHIRGGYGTNPMPDWHRVLRDTYGGSAEEGLVVRNLMTYVEMMQLK